MSDIIASWINHFINSIRISALCFSQYSMPCQVFYLQQWECRTFVPLVMSFAIKITLQKYITRYLLILLHIFKTRIFSDVNLLNFNWHQGLPKEHAGMYLVMVHQIKMFILLQVLPNVVFDDVWLFCAKMGKDCLQVGQPWLRS